MSPQNSEDVQRQERQSRQDRSRRSRRRAPIAGYLVILFAVAFLLLTLAYFQQNRANQTSIDNLQQTSNSALQSVQNLIEQNQELQNETAALKEQIDALEAENQRLTGESASYADQSQTRQLGLLAMDYFWQIDEAYVRQRYALCRELIQAFEAATANDTPLKTFLPTENTTGTDRFSPAARYQEIYDALY